MAYSLAGLGAVCVLVVLAVGLTTIIEWVLRKGSK